MARIQVLDKHTAELIAAGEVVERPASVVKELAENAIDAGASTITVEIKNGGVTYIGITDDGCGFDREDVPTAFLRHATSKIREEADLDGIATLGFRGEALASIAAVARVELITRTEDELAGTRYVIEGGEEIELTDAGCSRGTTICVRDLFYNVPARMKFLKKDVGEANAVAGVVDRLALSHPEISFRFIRDGRDELLTPGNGDLLACIGAVLGREFVKTLIPMDHTLGGVRVHGYICRPDGARPNRTMQHFFVNSRYVKTRTAAAALEQAYKGSVMVGKFPACVLHIDLPIETVDVNVHPAKIEVRFVNEKPVFDAVYHGVKSCLGGDTTPRQATLTPAMPVASPAKIVNPTPARETARQVAEQVTIPTAPATPARSMTNTYRPTTPVSRPASVLRDSGSHGGHLPWDIVVDEPVVTKPTVPVRPAEPTMPPAVPVIEKQETLLKQTETVRYIGEALHTYVLAEKGGSLFLIDKHAAHERILYNDLKKAQRHDAQYLLAPLTVALSREEYGVLLDEKEALTAAGFDVDDFGGTSLLVRAIPALLTGGDAADILREIAGGLLSGRREITTGTMDWIYHSVACRAAVKAGDNGTAPELAALAQRVLTDDDIRTCPHGRPVCVELTKKELEKQFGRIV
ncbi:MAG: DNA mismatch repair endonuclease MutL [Clostridia bacterium]|nr:DNA mismatch repair endonuclease MutL [Clostridia bacterium]